MGIPRGATGGGAGGGYSGINVGGGNWGGDKTRSLNPFDTSKQHEYAKEGRKNTQAHYEEQAPILKSMYEADDRYRSDWNAAADSWRADSKGLEKEAADQGNDARATYTNTIQPRLKGIMEKAGTEADSAMSLKDAGDPNNSIHTAVREMYNKQGQQARQQGQQDFGVLSALGAQAAGGQFGAAGPMTAGMQGQIYAQNQSQAGNAYAKAQGRMHDLQQQGIDRGFEASDAQYNRGLDAKDRYRQSIGDIGSAESDYMNKQQSIRGERAGHSGSRMGMEMDRANMKHGLDYGQQEREMTRLGQKYGMLQQGINNQMGAEGASKAGQMGFLGSVIGAGGAAYGGYASNPKNAG